MLSKCYIPCLILLTACSSTTGFERADQMKDYLTKRIPKGTKVEVAKRFLQSEGFQVSLKTNYLYGERSDSIVVIRRWQVSVIFKDDKVTEILVWTDTVAP